MSRVDELDVVIRHKGGKVIAGIPQIGLYARGDDVNVALAALDARKKAFMADLEDAGELELLEIENKPAVSRRGATRPAGDLGHFAMKAGIVVCCVVAGFVISSVLIVSKVELAVENTLNKVNSIKVSGAQFWSKVETELDRMASADNDLPEAKKQKLLTDIRAVATKWRPFVTELKSALADPNSLPPQSGTSAAK
jgi:hypothetical protein